MKFGAVPVENALGATLAHSVAIPTGRLRKGKRLDANDIVELTAAGIANITVAQLEPTDLDEDTAAHRIGQSLVASGLAAMPATTGRVNLTAQNAGIVDISADQVHAINLIDPGLTLATLPQYARVAPGDLVCTVKIIPYAVPEVSVARAQSIAQGTFALRQPVYKSATLIETTQPGNRPADKGRRVLVARLARLGLDLTPRVITHHTSQSLGQSLLQDTPGDVIFVLTDTATSDAHDVGPQALIDAGGTLTRFGIPVDPGNLLYLGHLGGKPVIGLPGCARSPALNGADWVMERALCGVDVTSDDMAKMGVGGLLKEIPTRPQPRQK